jgi:hypothetical protein
MTTSKIRHRAALGALIALLGFGTAAVGNVTSAAQAQPPQSSSASCVKKEAELNSAIARVKGEIRLLAAGVTKAEREEWKDLHKELVRLLIEKMLLGLTPARRQTADKGPV